ncbi:MAG: hypothetical protein M1828_005162 [Chrysothrix sp. TS-e1954]|nr:MAG: hypothetical protein M1828_005162 [Chrysothrix sp. TS-e1954]
MSSTSSSPEEDTPQAAERGRYLGKRDSSQNTEQRIAALREAKRISQSNTV